MKIKLMILEGVVVIGVLKYLTINKKGAAAPSNNFI